jgi:hypothetical protein
MLTNLLFTLLFVISLALSAQAQDATPSHVYQVTEKIRLELDLLNDANFSTVQSDTTASQSPAQPRHVLQAGRDAWRQLQLLRFMNGLPTQSLDPVPARAIKPADVKGLMEDILASLQELRPAYGVSVVPPEPPLSDGMTPTDVYKNLKRVALAIESMGVPATVPNDVYQMAQTILGDLRLVAATTDITYDLESAPKTTGKAPKDVYEASLALQQEIAALSDANPKYAIAGGAIAVQSNLSQITPADVISLLARSRADIAALKVTLSLADLTIEAPFVGGKTSSDVFHSIYLCRVIIAALAGRAAPTSS